MLTPHPRGRAALSDCPMLSPPLAAAQGRLRAKPHRSVPLSFTFMWALGCFQPQEVLCPSPGSCSKQMFSQGHPYRVSALPGEEQGWGCYGPDPPSPLRPSPLSFPAGSPASPRTSCSTAEAGSVGVQNPKRTNAALSRSSDSWPTHLTHHM